MRANLIKITFMALFAVAFLSGLNAQDKEPRKSLKAGVMQTLGIDTEITVIYSRPGVKGREIFGDLVPYGLEPGNKYSDNKPFPWRGGANENTTIEFSKDLLVDGNKLPAGKYGIHFIPGTEEWVVIFSNNSELWGSYKYDEKDDALRIVVKPEKANHQEWLRYGFDHLEGYKAVFFLPLG